MLSVRTHWEGAERREGQEAERWGVDPQVLDCQDTCVPGRPLPPWLWGLAHSPGASGSHQLNEGVVPDSLERPSSSLTCCHHWYKRALNALLTLEDAAGWLIPRSLPISIYHFYPLLPCSLAYGIKHIPNGHSYWHRIIKNHRFTIIIAIPIEHLLYAKHFLNVHVLTPQSYEIRTFIILILQTKTPKHTDATCPRSL